MRDELAEVVATVASDDALGALVITGAGRAFCAGADIGYMHDLVAREEWDTLEALVNLGAQVVLAIDSPRGKGTWLL
jgi:enoyl-CoA hydratase/carnithine racemase